MKILHIVSQDDGGAGRATVRLHLALLEHNIDSQIIVQNKTTDLASIHKMGQSRREKFSVLFRRFIDQSLSMFYKNKTRDIFSSTFTFCDNGIIKKIKEINPDIIHLHWINAGFINIFDLQELNKPILWSLHDANTYTGGCHVVHKGCEKYKTFCHSCPFLDSNFKYDLSYFNFKRKQKAYKNLNLTINGLSKWIALEAKSSTLLKDKPIINLPNTINTNIFRPIEKKIAREILNIDDLEKQKYLLGFGAISGTTIERKGYLQLKEALESLPNKHLYKLIVFGSSQGREIAGIKTVFLGHLYDDTTLSLLYSALDVFVTPSLAENLSNTIMESLSCGTPVVAFNIGGNSDLIIHKTNGYLAINTHDLSLGIQWCSQNLDQLSLQARQSIAKKFDYDIVAKEYIDQYKKMIKEKK